MIADATTPVMNVPMKPMNAFIIGVCIGAAALIAAVISASDFPCSLHHLPLRRVQFTEIIGERDGGEEER